jgi:DNA-binding MarR family transcriptional regulator
MLRYLSTRVLSCQPQCLGTLMRTKAQTTRRGDSVEEFLVEWRRERPDLDPWPTGILGRLHRLSARLLRRSEDWLGPLGLNWEAFSVIVTLRRSGKPYELRPTDILHDSLLTSGAITNRIDRVERLGLVQRRADKLDRRSCMVRLTPKGKQLADRAITAHFAALSRIIGVLNARERDQLAQLLSKLLASMEQVDRSELGPVRRNRISTAANGLRQVVRV